MEAPDAPVYWWIMSLRIALLAPGGSIHTRRWIEYFLERGHTVGLISYGPTYEQPSGVEVLLELPGLGLSWE